MDANCGVQGLSLNKNNTASELANDPCTDYAAAPLEVTVTDNPVERHYTIRGPPGTEFEALKYTFRPPATMMLTPNARFELNTEICISFTNSWGVRTAIIGLQRFFPLKSTTAVGVGALEYPTAERNRLAALSRNCMRARCNNASIEHLHDPPPSESSSSEDSSSSAANSTTPPFPAPAPAPPILIQKPEAPNVHRPIHPVAPKPTRPHVHNSIVMQSFTPPQLPTPEQPATRNHTPQPALVAAVRQTPPHPPIFVNNMIYVLPVLMFALVARRIL
ncbi:hypothetical protein C8Q76DRAFT_814784 [Earliella scabrosa]|nr:hypothetical protein C8Q76DRAFT_814784 [Earliella scabrosa]